MLPTLKAWGNGVPSRGQYVYCDEEKDCFKGAIDKTSKEKGLHPFSGRGQGVAETSEHEEEERRTDEATHA